MQQLTLLKQLDHNVAALRDLLHSPHSTAADRLRAENDITVLMAVKQMLREKREELDVSAWGHNAIEALAPARILLERAGLRLKFAANADAGEGSPDTDCALLQQEFPAVWTRLRQLWGLPACRNYLHGLLTGTLEDGPVGLPPDVASTLMRLQDEHDHKFPPKVQASHGIEWDLR